MAEKVSLGVLGCLSTLGSSSYGALWAFIYAGLATSSAVFGGPFSVLPFLFSIVSSSKDLVIYGLI